MSSWRLSRLLTHALPHSLVDSTSLILTSWEWMTNLLASAKGSTPSSAESYFQLIATSSIKNCRKAMRPVRLSYLYEVIIKFSSKVLLTEHLLLMTAWGGNWSHIRMDNLTMLMESARLYWNHSFIQPLRYHCWSHKISHLPAALTKEPVHVTSVLMELCDGRGHAANVALWAKGVWLGTSLHQWKQIRSRHEHKAIV